jgi:hypothetical protein
MGNKNFKKNIFGTGVLLITGAFLVNHYFKVNRSPQSTVVDSKGTLIEQSNNLETTATQPHVETASVLADSKGPILSALDKKYFSEFQQILKSKNDNDPRIDKNFRHFSTSLHRVFQDQYRNLPMESRNERGLIAFLVARDIQDQEDFDFLKEVYLENPCLSMENCSSRSHSDPHLSGIDQASMNYPQLAVLYQLERQLVENSKRFDDPNLKDQMKAILDQAAKFSVPSVQKKAEDIRSKTRL